MKIAIEALGIHRYGGGRTATLNLLEGLFEIDQKNDYLVILSKPEDSSFADAENFHQMIAPLKNRFLMRVWAQLVLPFHLRNYDLVHFVKNLGIFGLKCPTIVTVYDMTTLLHEEIFPVVDVWYWKKIQKMTLEQASYVIAISKATANDIHTIYNISPSKIKVIYPSISPSYTPASMKQIQLVKSKYDLPDNYLLHVGRIDKKKNLTTLIEAFAIVNSKRHLIDDIKLVIVGDVYYKSQDDVLLPKITQLNLIQDVIFTGNISDEDLPAVYSGALVFVYPSLHEGFGLVAVEAIACGTPVIAHKSGGVEEAVGSAALLLDSIDKETLADSIMQILIDDNLRKSMIEAGLEQAKRYNRQKNAQETLNLYRSFDVG